MKIVDVIPEHKRRKRQASFRIRKYEVKNADGEVIHTGDDFHEAFGIKQRVPGATCEGVYISRGN